MIEPPRILETPGVATAAIRLTVAREELPRVMGPAIGELLATLGSQGISPAGPVLAYHVRLDPAVFDLEVAVPVARPAAAQGRVRPSGLPAATVARTVYHGPYQGLHGAWMELMAWIAAQGRQPGPTIWEVYLTDPGSSPDPATWRTELNRLLL
jgi:effector-binding domain-containing protein